MLCRPRGSRHCAETLDDLIARNPDVRPEKLVSAHIEGRNDEGVVGSSMFLELARDPHILDMVEQVIGSDIVLWGCQIFCKPGGDGMEVPMHQDGEYWPIRPLANCTVWVAIDASKIENACLRIVPGSHREQRIFEHEHDMRDGLVLRDKVREEFIETEPVDVELEPGQMSLHDVYLIHGSNANRSDDAPRRRGDSLHAGDLVVRTVAHPPLRQFGLHSRLQHPPAMVDAGPGSCRQ